MGTDTLRSIATPVIDAVRAAYRCGLNLLPTKADGSKAPDAPNGWTELKDVQATPEQMRDFRFETRFGFGFVAGAGSGFRESWDFDTNEDFQAFLVKATECGLGDLVARLRAGYEDVTPGGGRRWLVEYPSDMPWAHGSKLARRPTRPEEKKHDHDNIKTLIEMPLFAILAPSGGATHPSGRPYVRVTGGFDTIESYTADERDDLMSLARTFDQMPLKAAREDRTSSSATSSATGNRPGEDWSRRTSWAEILVPAGWAFSHAKGVEDFWYRPGKTRGSHSATTNYEGSDRFCVFSSSTMFETVVDQGVTYSKFGVYTMLYHGGDFSKAASALAKLGYGRSTADGPGPAGRDQDDNDDDVTPLVDARWPAPLSRAAYVGVIGDIVDALAPETEADPAALLVQLLAMLGNVIKRTAHFRVEADTHYLNLFAVLVGKTSKGRKGVSEGRARHAFGSIDEAWMTQCQATGMSSGEGLIAAIRDPVEKQQPIYEGTGKSKRIVGYEAVIDDHGVADKRLYVNEGEFASTLKVMGREGNTLSPVLRNAWDGKSLRTLTKASPLRATGPHVTVLGNITQQEVRRYLDATESANGFGNRFLWVCVQRSKFLPDGGTFVALEPLIARLRACVALAQTCGEMQRDDEAKQLWHRVYRRLSAGRPGLLGALTARAEAQVMRLACLHALGAGSQVIRVPHLEAALEVWRYCFDSAAYVFGDALGDPEADKLLAALKAAGDAGLTRSEISYDIFQRHLPTTRLNHILAVLHDAGLAVQRQDTSSGGRPPKRWFFIPPSDKSDKSDKSPAAGHTHGTSIASIAPEREVEKTGEGTSIASIAFIAPEREIEKTGEGTSIASIASIAPEREIEKSEEVRPDDGGIEREKVFL